jgi:uncharacterized protein
MTKIVIDTNIYFSAFPFGGNIMQIIDKLEDENTIVYCSFQLWSEITQIFLCGRLEKVLKEKYDIEQAKNFLDSIQTNLKFVVPQSHVKICRDLKDNMILDLTKEINANYIIIGDKDLLTMEVFEHTKILKPSQFFIISQ